MKAHALKTYCAERGIKKKEMAAQLGVSQTFLSLMINYKRRPSPELAARIEKMTSGKVKFRELLMPQETQ